MRRWILLVVFSSCGASGPRLPPLAEGLPTCSPSQACASGVCVEFLGYDAFRCVEGDPCAPLDCDPDTFCLAFEQNPVSVACSRNRPP